MRLWMVLVGVDGALAVILGAYGAHALADADPTTLSLWDKANRYQMYHALALGVTAVWWERRGGGLLRAAAAFFVLGTVLFCGSLYAIAGAGWDVARVAPVGGVAFILGWLCLALAALVPGHRRARGDGG